MEAALALRRTLGRRWPARLPVLWNDCASRLYWEAADAGRLLLPGGSGGSQSLVDDSDRRRSDSCSARRGPEPVSLPPLRRPRAAALAMPLLECRGTPASPPGTGELPLLPPSCPAAAAARSNGLRGAGCGGSDGGGTAAATAAAGVAVGPGAASGCSAVIVASF